MQDYESKRALINEINKTSVLFIKEFDGIAEADKDIRVNQVDRAPSEMIAYQLGWMDLIRGWDKDELAGKEVITPAPGLKWNQMGEMYQNFYENYRAYTLGQLREMFTVAVGDLVEWFNGFTDDEVFKPGGRKWAASTASNWPIWKWVHINTVAPFKSFRGKIRKWKKVRDSQ
ncbi:MAG: ClbS/DfsB family four-helix bundle protein [Deltaproteobacteria bacterium]|jgi:hypothetical protein|nr:ClbS/DfsB family four-helix bundle protein [Deltaproteobacteria bacterium]